MKKRGKKLLSYLLALVLVLGIVPWISLTAKAEQIAISIIDAKAVDRTYEPGNKNVTINHIVFMDNVNGYILYLVKGRDYEVTGIMKDDKVGENKPVDVTVMLKDHDAYKLLSNTTTTTVNITEATPPTGDFDFTEPTSSVDMFRLYNPNSGEHFYTGNLSEKDSLINEGWNYEGVAWSAPDFSLTPVYRLYDKNAGTHRYTMDEDKRDGFIAEGWSDEGIGWYSDGNETIPVFGLYNKNALQAGAYHFTADTSERDNLIELGWRDEGIGWYGLGEDAA